MSASLSWVPKELPEPMYFSASSSLEAALERTFGPFPITLNENHLSNLEVIMNCGFFEVSHLTEAIVKNGCIEVNSHN